MRSAFRGYDAWKTHDPSLDRETPCMAYAPDGSLQCNLDCEHVVDRHEHWRPSRSFYALQSHDLTQSTEYGVVGEYDPASYKAGDLIEHKGGAYKVAEWPRRDDDFDEDGNPAMRTAKSRVAH